MSFFCTIYEAETGQYVQYIEAPDWLNVRLNAGADKVVVLGEFPPESYYKLGGVELMPPKPEGEFWTFDVEAERWVDPRTAADLAAALYTVREHTSLDKSELLTRMLMSGLLPVSDIEAAGEGRIPPSLEPALAMLPPEAQVVARIKWRNDPVISRTNPVIVLAGAALGMSEEQLDTLFGVVAPI